MGEHIEYALVRLCDQEEKKLVGLSRPELRLCLILVLCGCLFLKGSGYFRYFIIIIQYYS